MTAKRVALLLAVLLTPTPASWADPILIFNTGVDGSGAVLPAGSVDPHYAITLGTPSFPGPAAYVAIDDAGFPFPPWLANNSVSKWIAPDPNANQNFGDGALYHYETTFDLTGLIPSTASLSGQWASDNRTLQILLNGVDTGIPPNCADSTMDLTCFSMFHAFSITSGFMAGVNTLTFVLENGDSATGSFGGPSGLRVEVSGDASAVPEPGSLLLLGTGIGGAALRRWRRRGARG